MILDGFLDDHIRAAGPGQQGVGELAESVRDFVTAGGKRLRPVLCVLGRQAATEHDDATEAPEPLVRVASALELFHAFALIHDDVMDGSDLRRARP